MPDLKVIEFFVSLSKETETESDIKYLLSLVISDFKEDNFKIKNLSGGYVNSIIKVENGDMKLIVRVFTDKSDFLAPPEPCVLSMRAVQLAGLGPDVLAWFTHGVVYGYQEGELLAPDNADLNNPEIRRKIVKKTAALNQVDTNCLKIKGFTLAPNYQCEENLKRCFTILPDDYDGISFFKCDLITAASKESLLKEYEWISKEIISMELDNVFTHGDLWWGNMLYNTEKEEVNFIDYDLAGHNPFPIDLANVLMRMLITVYPATMPQLPETEEKALCRLYIEETRQIQGNSASVTGEDVMILFGLTKLFKTYLFYSLIAFVMTNIVAGGMKLHHLAEPWDKIYQLLKEDYIKFRRENKHLVLKKWRI